MLDIVSAGPAGGPLSAGRLSAAGSSRCCHLSYRSDRTGSAAGHRRRAPLKTLAAVAVGKSLVAQCISCFDGRRGGMILAQV